MRKNTAFSEIAALGDRASAPAPPCRRCRRRKPSTRKPTSIRALTRERVQHELHRRVLFAARAPDRDQEEHRDQLELPEQEEEDQVLRREHAHHGGLEHRSQAKYSRGRSVDAQEISVATTKSRRRQQHHRGAEAVDADEVLHVKPTSAASIQVRALGELQRESTLVEAERSTTSGRATRLITASPARERTSRCCSWSRGSSMTATAPRMGRKISSESNHAATSTAGSARARRWR